MNMQTQFAYPRRPGDPEPESRAAFLARHVDELGTLKARIADLTTRETYLKQLIAGDGPGAHEGHDWRVTVSVSTRETLDMAAVREKLSPQFIRAHTKSTEVVTVRVTARRRDQLQEVA